MNNINPIEISYTSFSSPLTPQQWQFYCHQLPLSLQPKVTRYRRWQDQHAALLSYSLLHQALVTAGYPADCLERLQHNEHGRPSIDSNIDFNLSHSGEYVVCLLMKGGRGGIDIERIRPIQISDFRSYMTPAEWFAINFPEVSYPKFYDYWTSKESVMKADGRGLYLPLLDIVIQGDQAKVYKTVWFLKKIAIDQNYVCHIATTWENPNVLLKEIKFSDNSPYALDNCQELV